jgi:hypothetical protein
MTARSAKKEGRRKSNSRRRPQSLSAELHFQTAPLPIALVGLTQEGRSL